MSFRSLLNAAYAYLAEGRDKDGLQELDDALTLEPVAGRGGPKPRSRGTAKLMLALGAPPPRPKKAAG